MHTFRSCRTSLRRLSTKRLHGLLPLPAAFRFLPCLPCHVLIKAAATIDQSAYDRVVPDDPFKQEADLMSALERSLGLRPSGLVVPRDGVRYISGTMVPILGPVSSDQRQSLGLRIPGSAPAEDDFMGTYVTLSDYNPTPGPYDIPAFAETQRRESLLIALVAINRASQSEQTYDDLVEGFKRSLEVDARGRLEAALRMPSGGMGHMLLAPHPMLLAIRWVIGNAPKSEPLDDRTNVAKAVLFVHAIADNIRDFSTENLNTSQTLLILMLVMMNLGTISASDDINSSIDRTTRLWNEYGELARERLGSSARELLFAATGLEAEDFLALGFALYTHASLWKPGEPVALNRAIHPSMPTALLEKGLSILSMPLADCFEAVGPARSDFDLLALESRPVLEVKEGLLVVDAGLLWRRCTSGLFWAVHDWLRDRSQDEAASFREAYGAMVEAMVEDSLRSIAPVDLGTQRTFFTEEDLAAAYGQVSRCDAVIDFGTEILLIEVVSGQLTVPTRVKGDLDQLEKDFKKLVLLKCEQLDNTARLLFADEEPLTGVPHRTRSLTCIPVLVVGGGFPLNALSTGYVESRLAAQGLLTDPRIQPLCIVDLEDIDHLEGLSERGLSAPTLLTDWRASDIGSLPLNNYLRRYHPGQERRPSRMSSVDATYDEIKRRLGFQLE